LAKSYKNQINEKRPFGRIKIPQSTPADVGPDWQQYYTGLGGGPCHHELDSWQFGLLERRAQTLAHGS